MAQDLTMCELLHLVKALRYSRNQMLLRHQLLMLHIYFRSIVILNTNLLAIWQQAKVQNLVARACLFL
jgi:hypothetical protein